MTTSEFEQYVNQSLQSLPSDVVDTNLSADERKLEALICLSTNIHPHIKNDTGTLIEILQMKDGPEKLRLAILWDIAVSRTSPADMQRIIGLMDEYLNKAIS